MANDDYKDISCLEEWLERKGWSLDLPEEAQTLLESQFLGEYAVVRAALWQRHYQSLDEPEKILLDSEAHPSYSGDRAEQAELYLHEFRNKLATHGFVASVTMGRYHGNTIVFTVHLNQNLHWRDYRKSVPEFYRGFQVFVVNPRRRAQKD